MFLVTRMVSKSKCLQWRIQENSDYSSNWSQDRIIDRFILEPKLEERKKTRPENLTTAQVVVAVVWIRPCW